MGVIKGVIYNFLPFLVNYGELFCKIFVHFFKTLMVGGGGSQTNLLHSLFFSISLSLVNRRGTAVATTSYLSRPFTSCDHHTGSVVFPWLRGPPEWRLVILRSGINWLHTHSLAGQPPLLRLTPPPHHLIMQKSFSSAIEILHVHSNKRYFDSTNGSVFPGLRKISRQFSFIILVVCYCPWSSLVELRPP